MALSRKPNRKRIVVDSIHGDITLEENEWRVIDTAPFQRLRHIKQLGFAHLTYPNATHTRFAHSLGVFAVMCRILNRAKQNGVGISPEEEANLRLAALVHDIGHYPYSHLMEYVDFVKLTEDQVQAIDATNRQYFPAKPGKRRIYPTHEKVGDYIIRNQKDLVEALGGPDRAEAVANLLTGAGPEKLAQLIHSSFDMDRIDYLLRDSHATGVPYGIIDINYLLNQLRVSADGIAGISEKALPAVEHMLWARYYMHQVVYFHKTTFGFEEACRQLLKRLRNCGELGVPADGSEILELVAGDRIGTFVDSYIDQIILKASTKDLENVKKHDPSQETVIRSLARCLVARKPPKLLKEVSVIVGDGNDVHAGDLFYQACKFQLADLAAKHKIPLGQFLLCRLPKSLRLEQRGRLVSVAEAQTLSPAKERELTMVFVGNDPEPKPIVEVQQSLLHDHSNFAFLCFRLYVVYEGNDRDAKIKSLSKAVSTWGTSD